LGFTKTSGKCIILNFLKDNDDVDTNVNLSINEYKGHKCSGYNIEANFFDYEKYIITGSEDSFIYLYDVITSRNIKKYKTNQKCVNLVSIIALMYP